MDRDETDLFFGCLMGLVVFFAVAMAIILSTNSTPAPIPPPPISTTELYTRLVMVCKAIDIFDNVECSSFVYMQLQDRGLMP